MPVGSMTPKRGSFDEDVAQSLGNVFIHGAPDANSVLFYELSSDNIASAGSTQPTATPTLTQTIRVTSGTGGILLPPSAAGLEVLVVNHSGANCQVYGAGTDLIDDIANATGVSQMNNSLVIYTCATAGKWYSEGLATGFDPVSALQTQSYVDGLTAHAGGGQVSALPLTKMINRVTTVATAGDSVLMPPSKPGMIVTVMNGAASNSMNIFPATGDAINALGANTAFAAAAGTLTIFYCWTAGQWFTK